MRLLAPACVRMIMRRVSLGLVLLAACGDSKPPVAPPPRAVVVEAAPAPRVVHRPEPGLPAHALHRLGSPRFRHPSGFGVDATPDGSRLISRTATGDLRVWDSATGELLGAQKTFVGGMLLPDGKRVITDKGVLSITGDVLAASPTGYRGAVGATRLVTVAKPDVTIYDATSLRKLGSFKVRGDVDEVALSPDEKRLAIAENETVTLYDLPGGALHGKQVKFRERPHNLTFVGAKLLAGAMNVDSVAVHDIASGRRVFEWKGEGDVAVVTHTEGMRDGVHLVVTLNGVDSRILDVLKGTSVALATAPTVGIAAVELPNGIVAVQTTDSIRHFAIATGKRLDPVEGHEGTVTGLAFDGTALLSSSIDGQVLRWDVAASRVVKRHAHTQGLDGLALSPAGDRVAAPGLYARVLDAKTLEPTNANAGANDAAWIGSELVAGQGFGSVSVGSRTIENLDCGAMVCQLAVTSKGAVAIGDDNGQKLVIADSFDAIARAPRIDVCGGYLRGLDRTATRVAFVGDSCSRLLDIRGATIVELAREDHRVTSVAFSATQLAVGWSDGLVELREPDKGTVVTSYPGHRDAVSALAFDSSGLLASGSTDGTILIWPTK